MFLPSLMILAALGLSCKDLGDAVPPAPITFNVGSISVGVSNVATAKISGGTKPYTVVSNSDAAKVTPTISSDTLSVRGLAAGNATITVGDNSSPRLTSSIAVTVVLINISPNSATLTVGDSTTATINGGTAPYSIVSVGDPAKVNATISGSTLKVRALAAGTSTVTVGDNSSPRFTTTMNVTVAAPISFSTQVQPIFTASCANAGCHPGGGAPFPLLSANSYVNLYNAQATTSCTSDKRVLPGNAAASVLYKKISGSTCGDRMPLGRAQLSQAEIDLIRDWINQGARNN
jgi:hypothetical protein